jgi:lipopolysaccharide heptosyltransferase II
MRGQLTKIPKPSPSARFKASLRAAIARVVWLVVWCGSPRDFRRRRAPASVPKRILVLNGAHIGDMVISTSLVPVLRSAYPEAEIGFVAGSWSSMVLRDLPGVKWIHEIDHWRLNRSAAGRLAKIRRSGRMRRAALRQIRSIGYDLSLSIFPAYPDFLDVAWQARIPARLGFRGSPLAPLATALADFPQESAFLTQGARQAEILRPLRLAKEDLSKRKPMLAPSDAQAVAEVCAVLGVRDASEARYYILHMGAGAARREMPVEFWHEVAKTLSSRSVVVFTGRGRRESENAERAMMGLSECINACDRLTWKGFVAAVRHAEMLLGVESMAGHVAAAVGTECRVVYAGMSGVARWRPEGAQVMVLTNHLPCAPCLLGCREMECLRGITPESILQ